jgi:hypothetical protein
MKFRLFPLTKGSASAHRPTDRVRSMLLSLRRPSWPRERRTKKQSKVFGFFLACATLEGACDWQRPAICLSLRTHRAPKRRFQHFVCLGLSSKERSGKTEHRIFCSIQLTYCPFFALRDGAKHLLRHIWAWRNVLESKWKIMEL